jgi:hypothetical protein
MIFSFSLQRMQEIDDGDDFDDDDVFSPIST